MLVATLVQQFRTQALFQELLAEASALPPETSGHLGRVVRNVLQPDGKTSQIITAACQEVCLQLFGGQELPTELNHLSDAFRPPAPLPPALRMRSIEECIPDDAALANAAFAARRQEHSKGA